MKSSKLNFTHTFRKYLGKDQFNYLKHSFNIDTIANIKTAGCGAVGVHTEGVTFALIFTG